MNITNEDRLLAAKLQGIGQFQRPNDAKGMIASILAEQREKYETTISELKQADKEHAGVSRVRDERLAECQEQLSDCKKTLAYIIPLIENLPSDCMGVHEDNFDDDGVPQTVWYYRDEWLEAARKLVPTPPITNEGE